MRKVDPSEVADIIDIAKKEQLVFSKKTQLYAYELDGEIVAISGIAEYGNKSIIKNHYVLNKYRGRGIFKEMFRYMELIAQSNRLEATCTPMSIRHYLKNGFNVVKTYKNGCTKVIKDNK